MQPTRLNVVKNDSDTWDYTNPNLGNLLFSLISNITRDINFDICLDVVYSEEIG